MQDTAMTFEQAKVRQDELETAVKHTGIVLNEFPRSGIGLVPDSIRTSPEYQAAKKAYNDAFGALRNFNVTFVKQFREELREERRIRMGVLAKINDA